MKLIHLLPPIITCCSLFFKGCASSAIEQVIKNSILSGYDKSVRPVKNISNAISVRLNPGLFCFISINAAQHEITIKQWQRMYWRDEFLSWNPQDYDGVDHIKIFQSEIWLPDIIMLTMTSKEQLPNDESIIKISSDGSVRYAAAQMVTFYCQFDVSYFPFDKQNCTLTYSSWNYNSNEIDLDITSPADLNAYHENNEWTLLKYSSWKSLDPTDDAGDIYVLANFDVVIARKPYYYVNTFVWPSFIITCLSIIGVFSPFNEAGEREERVTLGLTTLLTMAVVLMIITDQMPKSSSGISLLGMFVMAEIIVSAFATIAATIIIHLHSSWMEKEKVPECLWAITCRPKTKQKITPQIASQRKASMNSTANNLRSSLTTDNMDEMVKETLRQDWSTVTKRLDFILLVVFLTINSIVITVFLLVGNFKLKE